MNFIQNSRFVFNKYQVQGFCLLKVLSYRLKGHFEVVFGFKIGPKQKKNSLLIKLEY